MQPRPEVGVLVNDLGVVTDGAAQVAGLVEQRGTVVERHEVLGLQLQHEVKVGDGAVVVAHLGAKQSTVVVSEEVIGVEVKCGIIVGHGSAQVVLVVTCQGTVDVVICLFWKQMDGFAQVLLRFFPLAACQADNGASRPDIAVVGVELQALVECDDGIGGVLLQHIDLGANGIAAGILAPACQHGVELEMGLRIVFLLNAAEDAVVPQVLPLRVVTQRLGIVADGVLVFLLIDTCESAQLVEVDDVGVTLNGCRTVALGTGEVVKVILGNGTEEPRLIEIGLGGNGLVEVLDAQHIVLVIKCRASYHHQPVGIELRKRS